jgi:hypothetical protein
MTHDELLYALDKNLVMTGAFMATHEATSNLYRKGLIAVVELHGDDHGMCMTCDMENYPCATIQALEKELL